jgi:hypothetical protein
VHVLFKAKIFVSKTQLAPYFAVQMQELILVPLIVARDFAMVIILENNAIQLNVQLWVEHKHVRIHILHVLHQQYPIHFNLITKHGNQLERL